MLTHCRWVPILIGQLASCVTIGNCLSLSFLASQIGTVTPALQGYYEDEGQSIKGRGSDTWWVLSKWQLIVSINVYESFMFNYHCKQEYM